MFWVYMLKCADGSFYVGHTDSLEMRIQKHIHGALPSCYTFSRRPVELAFSQDFPTRDQAFEMERRIKGWSRAKKAALVRGDWNEISRLGKVKTHPSTGSG